MVSETRYVGWVPNISGRILSSDNIHLHFSSHSSYSCIQYTFSCSFEGQIIFVCRKSDESNPIARIDLIDSKGLCYISPMNSKLVKEELIGVWVEFRMALDGCSGTVCDCTAMTDIFPLESNHIIPIMDGFIRCAEGITDYKNHISLKRIRVSKLKDVINAQSKLYANKVYFDSFVRLYGDKLNPDVLQSYVEEFNLRICKFDIATANYVTVFNNLYVSRTIFWAAMGVIFAAVTFLSQLFF